MKPVCSLVHPHVLVSLKLTHAPLLVLRVALVMMAYITMELAVFPLTSAAVITMAKLIR